MITKDDLILITGGGGYVGSALARYLLDKGFRVRILDIFIHGKDAVQTILNDPNCTHIEGDIRDVDVVAKSMEGVSYLIHLAAITGAPESERVPELTWGVNLDGAKNIFRCAAGAGVKHVIYASTCSNYGASGGDIFVAEDSELNPISPYAESKVKAEEFLLSGELSGLNFTICRFATVYGLSPRMRFDLLLNEFVRDGYTKKALTIFGEQHRTFVHVKDVVRALHLILDSSPELTRGQVFNVGSTLHSNFSKSDLGRKVKEQLPNVELNLVDKVLDGRDYKVSFEKIHRVLGFDTEYKVEDGIAEIISFLRENPDVDPYSRKFSSFEKYLQLNDLNPAEKLKLTREAVRVRRQVLEMVTRANSGHIPSALSIVEILLVLYHKILKVSPENPGDAMRDKFILSKGHGCAALYGVLANMGFFPESELARYETINGILGGHPDRENVPGVEVSTGSLGQGFPMGVGLAFSAKLKGMGNRVFCVVGDGECNEGSIWEAAAIAAHFKLDNLVVIVDHNKQQSSGPVDEVLCPMDLPGKWKAFGWNVAEVNGHDIAYLYSNLSRTPRVPDVPTVLIAHTIKGKGISFMEGQKKWHTLVPTKEEYGQAMDEFARLEATLI